MARIPFIESQVGGPGVADLATARPNQALGQLAQEAGRADSILDALGEREAAINGAKALADFKIARMERIAKLQTEAQSPDGFADLVTQDFEQASQKLIQAHSNPRVQAFLEQRLVNAREDELRGARQWEALVRTKQARNVAFDTVGTLANMVARNPGAAASAVGDVDAMLEASGLSFVDADEIRLKGQSAIYGSAIDAMISAVPDQAKKELQSGAWDGRQIDVGEKLRAADREIKRREEEEKANAAAARAENYQDALDLMQSDIAGRQATGRGVSPEDQARIRAGLSDKQLARYESMAAQADLDFQATGNLRSLPNSELFSTVEKLKPTVGADGFVASDFQDKQAAYNRAVSLRDKIIQERKEDPALAARASFTSVRDRWAAYEAEPNKDKLRDAIKAGLAAQEAMGIPANQRAPMPHGMAIAIAGGIKGAKPEAAAKELQAAAEQFGSYWPQAFKQMSKHLDGHARVAATIVDQKEAALLIEGSRQSVDALRKANGVKSGDDGIQRAAADDDRVKDLVVSLSQRGGGSATATQLIQSIEVHALSRMRVYGESQATATENAIQKIVSDRYDFARTGGQAFRVPKTAGDASAVEAGARGVRQSIDLSDVDMPGVPAGTVVEPLRQSYIAAIRRNGYWVTNDDETGAILYNERGVPVTKNGRPVAATWAELQRGDERVPGLQPLGRDFVRERFQIRGQ